MVRRFLIIEDNTEDFAAIVRTLGCGPDDISITRCINGDDALDILRDGKTALLPDVILLDLNLPGTDGREILVEIKSDAQLRPIPIVILSTSRYPKDVAYCYDRGASAYFFKALDRVTFDETMRAIDVFWRRSIALPSHVYCR